MAITFVGMVESKGLFCMSLAAFARFSLSAVVILDFIVGELVLGGITVLSLVFV